MNIHKRYSDKAKNMYFMIKGEKTFDKYIAIYKIRKIFSQLIYNEKYLKAEKRFNTKESFQCFIYQEYCLIEFIENMKTIILKWF